MRIHILDDWFDTLRALPSFARLAGHEVTVWTDHLTDEAALAQRLAGGEALVLFRERTPISEGLLSRLPDLRLISQRGVYPHVDVAACTAHRVLLCSDTGSDKPSYAAAELTWALILAAMRQLPRQMASARAGRWQAGVGKSLRGRVLGLYGYGRIGKVVAGYARAFGMKVLWWGSDAGRARARAAGEEVVEIGVPPSLPIKSAVRIGAGDFAAMKPGSVLVNTSRAGLVQSAALLAALNKGRPGIAALDVFDVEPMTDPDDPLVSHPNVIATPHIGFVTEDELDSQFSDIYDQINAYATGAPVHMINPEVWKP